MSKVSTVNHSFVSSILQRQYSAAQAITVYRRTIPAGVTRYETVERGQLVHGGINDPRLGSSYDQTDPTMSECLRIQLMSWAITIHHFVPHLIDIGCLTLQRRDKLLYTNEYIVNTVSCHKFSDRIPKWILAEESQTGTHSN
jgi:hypothetical protein